MDFLKRNERAFIIIGLYSILSSSYLMINKLTEYREKYYVLETSFDRLVPLVPEFSWIYAIYLIVVLSPVFILDNIDDFRKTGICYIVEYLIAYFFYLSLPVKMIRPEIFVSDIHTQMLDLIYYVDMPFNCFPSLHVGTSFLASMISSHHNKKAGSVLYLTSILIALSTLFTKEHYLLDLVAGWFLAYFIYREIYVRNLVYSKLHDVVRGFFEWAK